MYIQGLLLNEKDFLLPNDCHRGETNCTGYDPNQLLQLCTARTAWSDSGIRPKTSLSTESDRSGPFR